MSEDALFLRHFMGDRPGGSGAGQSMSNSPDIILTGTKPVPVGELATPKSYETEPPDTMIVGSGETNYIYVRALNAGAEQVGGRLWLWYAEPGLLLWPQSWKHKEFSVNGTGQNWADVTAGPNQITVANAFELVDPSPPLDHYAMIAMSQSPVSQDPEPPFPGHFTSVQEFALWIQTNPNAAWRDTVDLPAGKSTWSYGVPIQGPSDAEQLNIGLQLKNMPVGSRYSFTIPGGKTLDGEEWQPVQVSPRTVQQPDENVMVRVQWPGGVNTAMTVTWWAEGTTPGPGATIEPVVGIEALQLEGQAEDPLRGSVEMVLHEDADDVTGGRPVLMRIIGGMSIRLRGEG
ncbi:MAG TPA: hypothetical protein VGV69_00780 [Solirubrobacterales bacterium]|nr:hypothetical protein [Solirubrobacterales bacterium]